MGKKLGLFGVALVLAALVVMVFAGSALASYNWSTNTADHSAVAGSVHDKSTATDPNPCDSCHIPHGGSPTGFLWAKPLKADKNGMTGNVTTNDDENVSSDIKPLCYSCHDGTIASKGMARVFSATHTNHRTRAADAIKPAVLNPDGSVKTPAAPYGPGRDCDLCHDPHDDGNKNYRVVNADGSITNNKTGFTGASSFLKYERYSSKSGAWSSLYPGGNFCGSCHSGNMANSATASTHPLDVVPGANTARSHTPYDQYWTPEVNADYKGTRLFDKTTRLESDATGAVVNCESCHGPHGTDPAAVATTSTGEEFHSLNTMGVEPKLGTDGKPLPVDPNDPTTVYLCVNCH